MKLLLGLLAVVSTSSAFATPAHSEIRLVAYYHFSGVAFAKSVDSVTVHTGILQRDQRLQESPQFFWKDVQDLVMSRAGDGFFAKTVLKTWDGVHPGGSSQSQGMMAQYFVRFADGTTLTTTAALHATNRARDCADGGYFSALTQFGATSSVGATRAEKFSCSLLDAKSTEISVLGAEI